MNKILKNTVILTIITLVSGVALGGVYQITKEPIAKAQEEAKQEAYQQVFEDADTFEVLKVDAQEAADAVASAGVDDGAVIDEAVEAIQGGETIGYVITSTDTEAISRCLSVFKAMELSAGLRSFPSVRPQVLV